MVYRIFQTMQTISITHSDISAASANPDSLASIFLGKLSLKDGSQSASILELGAGCGTVGLALARVLPRSRVLLTDLAEAVGVMEANVHCLQSPVHGDAHVGCMILDWHDVLQDPTRTMGRLRATVLGDQLDMIMVSDCTYNEDTLEILVDTLHTLVAGYNRSDSASSPTVVVARKPRHDSEEAFFRMMEQYFVQEQVVTVALPDRSTQNEKPSASAAVTGAEAVHIHVYKCR